MAAEGPVPAVLTPSALSTRRWRDRRRRGVHMISVEVDGEAVQGLIAAGLVSADDESPKAIMQGVQKLLSISAEGRLKKGT